MKVIERIRKTGERYVPHRSPDGTFRVADPILGKTRHHSKNQIVVPTEVDLLGFIGRGFYVRMRGEWTGQVNLIRPHEIVVR